MIHDGRMFEDYNSKGDIAFPTVNRLLIHVRQADTSMLQKPIFPWCDEFQLTEVSASPPFRFLSSLSSTSPPGGCALRQPAYSVGLRTFHLYCEIVARKVDPHSLEREALPDRPCHDECQQNPTMGPSIRYPLLFSLVSNEYTSQRRFFPRFPTLRDGMARRLHDRRFDRGHGHSTRSGSSVRV